MACVEFCLCIAIWNLPFMVLFSFNGKCMLILIVNY